MLFVRMLLLTVVVCAGIPTSLMGCRPWINPIWAKSRQSDTALFRFVIGGKVGYIDASGAIVIAPQSQGPSSENADDFFEGVAAARDRESKFIDSRGASLSFTPYEIPVSAHFSHGLTAAAMGEGNSRKYGFVGKDGKLAIGVQFDEVRGFSEGLAAVRVGAKWGYIDRTGAFTLGPQFLFAGEFSEGVARVVTEGPCHFVTSATACDLDIRLLGGARGETKKDALKYSECQYTFVGREGAPLFQSRYRKALDFAEGLAAVREDGGWGFIDRAGKVRIPFQFDEVGSFSEGMAAFRQGGKWGFIDKTGRIVIPAQYAWANEFSAGAAVVGRVDEGFWFIDKTGAQLFGKTFREATTFRLGLAHVSDGRNCSYIDRTGRVVFSYPAMR